MIIPIIIFIVSLVFLLKGSDYLIKASSSIAKKLGISEFVIGLTLVALGTSIPELATSVIASLKHESGIILGNVIGSNIANIGLVLGLTAAIILVKTRQEMLKRDGYMLIFITFLFYIFILNLYISRLEAMIFLVIYIVYMFYLLQEKPGKKEYHFGHFLTYFLKFQYITTIRSKIIANNKNKTTPYEKRKAKTAFKEGLFKDFIIVIVSGAAVVISASFLIKEAIFFANFFNVPGTIVGISAIALGTSLPELTVSIAAARKKLGNIAVGNIIGSNIANLLLVVGVSSLMSPLIVLKQTLLYLAPFMVIMTILLLIFIKSHWQLRRKEGIILVIVYLLFLTLIFFGII